ncbi:MAG: DUF4390 domain-containing protein [Nitrospinota bacterium]
MGKNPEGRGRGADGRGSLALASLLPPALARPWAAIPARGALAALAVALVLSLAPVRAARGQSPRLTDLVVIGMDTQVLLFATLEGAFSKDLLEAIQSGVPATFEYTIALLRARRFWYDERVSQKRVFHSVKFDALKKEYTFTSASDQGERYVKVTKDAEEMRDWMAELNGEAIALRGQLLDGGQYYVRMKADINSPHFAFPLNYLLFFLSWETPWAASEPFTPGDL